MQVLVETTSSLGRRLAVTIPPDQVEGAITDRLKRLSQTVRMEGFRPGKVPARLIEQRYGAAVRGEVIEEILQTSLNEAVTQEKLRPAGRPIIQSIKADKDQPLEYTVTFEVYPEIELHSLADIVLEKFVVVIAEADVDRVLEQMRKQHAQWDIVQRPAEWGDQLVIDLHWTDSEGNKQEQKNLDLVLEKGAIPVEFEALEGSKAGDEINMQIPIQGIENRELVPAIVKISSVAMAKLPELNDAFAEQFDVEGGLEVLRAEVRKHMELQLEDTLKNKLTIQLTEKLLERHPIEVPKMLVEEEVERQEKEFLARLAKEMPQDPSKQVPDAVKSNIQTIAQRRVALSLLYGAAIEKYGIKVDSARVRAKVERIAAAFQVPEPMVERIYSDKNIIRNLRTQVLEEQVIEKLLEQVQYAEKAAGYSDIVKLTEIHQQQMVEHKHDHHHHEHEHHHHEHEHHEHEHDE